MAAKKKVSKKKAVKKKTAKKPVKKKVTKKKVMGRPKSVIDWDIVIKLGGIFCTKTEICSVIGVSEKTLQRACHTKFNETFDHLYRKWSAFGRSSLRRLQYEKAEEGNTAMLIWMGRQHLGQKDLPFDEGDDKGTILEAIDQMKKNPY